MLQPDRNLNICGTQSQTSQEVPTVDQCVWTGILRHPLLAPAMHIVCSRLPPATAHQAIPAAKIAIDIIAPVGRRLSRQ